MVLAEAERVAKRLVRVLAEQRRGFQRNGAAGQVVDAIREECFHLLTHEGSEHALEARMKNIILADDTSGQGHILGDIGGEHRGIVVPLGPDFDLAAPRGLGRVAETLRA